MANTFMLLGLGLILFLSRISDAQHPGGAIPVPGNLSFRHIVIDPDPPGAHHDILLVTDLTGNGLPDVIIGCKQGPVNLFWYENPGSADEPWVRHDIAHAPELEAGGALLDVDRDGRVDIIAGQQIRSHELYWFQQPPDPRGPWRRYVLENRFEKYHDQVVGDVDNDGQRELLFCSQRSGILAYYDLPDDPTVEPWPRECFHLISDQAHGVEGLVVADVDGDGLQEVLAGTCIWRCAGPGGAWEATPFATGYTMTRLAVGDLDGDGSPEVVVAEGESDRGRLMWCKPPHGPAQILRDDLFHPHSLSLADFTGDGTLDIFVGEMGLGKKADPHLFVFVNSGEAHFEPLVVSVGIPTHEAKVADLNADGHPDIVGKPYFPEKHIDAWLNQAP
jgi:hypothetical protein